MDKTFAGLFSKQPDEIFCGDYLYNPRSRTKWPEEIARMLGMSYDENQKQIENRIRADFKQNWEKRTLGKTDPYYYEPWIENSSAAHIINQIASGCIPFMDIASSESMGFAPYIVKQNPETPCLITDIDAGIIKILRSCANEHLPENNISFASFDNLDMPLRDNSLNYITSRYGITSSSGTAPADGSKANIYQYSAGREKPISEVYRVLKPGGRFMTLEMNMECDFDLRKVYDYYIKSGSLYGIYTYDEIQAVLELLIDEPWHAEFKAAGFEVELEKKYYKKYSLGQVMSYLHGFTSYHSIRQWEKRTWREELQTDNFVWDYAREAESAEDIGIDFYEVDILYILRKPD